MKYLILKFRDAALITQGISKKFQHFVRHIGVIDGEIPDMDTPISADQLSNVLHVMLNLAPCATKRNTVFKRNEVIYNMSKNAYIRYDKIINQEAIQNPKIIDSSTAPIHDIKGNNGVYDWMHFKRAAYSSPKTLEEVFRLFNYICKVDDVTKKYTIHQVADIIKNNKDNEILRDFIAHRAKIFMNKNALDALEKTYHIAVDRLETGEKPRLRVPSPFWYLLFGVPFKGGNIIADRAYNPNAILVPRGVEYRKTKFSGEIIVPVDKNEIVEQIQSNGCCPTVLEGGMITIVGLQNSISEAVLNDKFEKIFVEKSSEASENKTII